MPPKIPENLADPETMRYRPVKEILERAKNEKPYKEPEQASLSVIEKKIKSAFADEYPDMSQKVLGTVMKDISASLKKADVNSDKKLSSEEWDSFLGNLPPAGGEQIVCSKVRAKIESQDR